MRAAAAMLALMGCTSSEGGGNVVHGTVGGKAIHIADAASGAVQSSPDGMGYAEVLLSTAPDVCGDASTNTLRANATTIDIELVNNTGMAVLVPSTTGTYTIGGLPLRAVAFVRVFDSQCQVASTSMSGAVSGKVDVTAIHGNAFEGSFDLALDSQDHITGSFEPTQCPSFGAMSGSATCM